VPAYPGCPGKMPLNGCSSSSISSSSSSSSCSSSSSSSSSKVAVSSAVGKAKAGCGIGSVLAQDLGNGAECLAINPLDTWCTQLGFCCPDPAA